MRFSMMTNGAQRRWEENEVSLGVPFCSRKQNECDEKINNICAHKGTHAHICENTYFINFDPLQNSWIHDSRQLVFFCRRRCLRRDLTRRDCVVRRFPGPIGRVLLITSVERVYKTPPIKLRFYSHHQIICSSSIYNIWSIEKVWVALFRRNPVTTVCRHVGDRRKILMKGWLSPHRCPVIRPSFIQHGYMCIAFALSVPGKIVSNPVIWDMSMESWPRLVGT